MDRNAMDKLKYLIPEILQSASKSCLLNCRSKNLFFGFLLVASQSVSQSVIAQDLTSQASNLCSMAAGTFITGQYSAQQVLGAQALQVAQQQTGGTGVYQQLQPYGAASGVMITNPHYDQDQTQGQLFHFFCTTQHMSGFLSWELKFSPATSKIVYYSFEPARQQTTQMPQQQMPQQQTTQIPQQQMPQIPQQQMPQIPQQQMPQIPQQQMPQIPQQQMPQMPQQQTTQIPQQQMPQVPQQQMPQVPQQQQSPQQQTQNPSKEDACKMFPGMC